MNPSYKENFKSYEKSEKIFPVIRTQKIFLQTFIIS